jgi:hypothetical protein
LGSLFSGEENDSLVQLDFNLNFVQVILTNIKLGDVEYDLSTNKLYVVSCTNKSIWIYNSINETDFTLNHSISHSDEPLSLALYLDSLYFGDENGKIYEYNAQNYTYIKQMTNLCSGADQSISSIKFDSNGNMAYSCFGKRNQNNDSSLNIQCNGGTIKRMIYTQGVYGVMFDSSNRLWVALDENLITYN